MIRTREMNTSGHSAPASNGEKEKVMTLRYGERSRASAVRNESRPYETNNDGSHWECLMGRRLETGQLQINCSYTQKPFMFRQAQQEWLHTSFTTPQKSLFFSGQQAPPQAYLFNHMRFIKPSFIMNWCFRAPSACTTTSTINAVTSTS